MYHKIEGGSTVIVHDNAFGFDYECQLPSIGKGVNIMTGALEDVEVIKRSDVPEEQYWQRIPLPADYKERRKKEFSIQKLDKLYVDPYLEDFRKKDWHRRLCGLWFWRFNPRLGHSECIYMTGQQFLYTNWWVYQGKYMDYREPDRETFYVYAYCQEDPHCLGTNELTQRKSGKTGRAGCVAYERTSRLANHHCGLQSKGDDDAQNMFKKAIIGPWRKLPHFHRPIYDLMKGEDPNELRFFATSRRGAQVEEEEAEEALESFMDYGPADEGVYDGPQLETYISDETGKTRRNVSIRERMRVVREASEVSGELIGYHISTTTVEVEEGEEENEEFQEFTNQSNPLVRDDNGMTISGYYTFFQPCYKYMYFDRYGFPDEEKAKVFVLNRRKKLEEEGDLRGLSSYKRKKPMTFKEAFAVDGLNSLFNPELIQEQLDSISWGEDRTERGDLEWEGGFEYVIEKLQPDGTKKLVPNKLNWVPKLTGKFEKVKGWFPKEPNKVYENNGHYLPNNNFAYRIGCDPFKYDKTKDKRRSNCAAFVYQIADDLFPDPVYDDMMTMMYLGRPEGTMLANAEILKMAWWCGCQVLFERNINHWKDHFKMWNCYGFLMFMPGEDEPGLITDGAGKTTQTICNYTEAYINQHIKKVFFKKLMNKEVGWLGFKVEETQKFDPVMGAGFTLVAVKGKRYIRPVEHQRDIESIMPLNKAI